MFRPGTADGHLYTRILSYPGHLRLVVALRSLCSAFTHQGSQRSTIKPFCLTTHHVVQHWLVNNNTPVSSSLSFLVTCEHRTFVTLSEDVIERLSRSSLASRCTISTNGRRATEILRLRLCHPLTINRKMLLNGAISVCLLRWYPRPYRPCFPITALCTGHH